MNAVKEPLSSEKNNKREDIPINSDSSFEDSKLKLDCPEQKLSNLEFTFTMTYIALILIFCLYFSFSQDAKNTILKPLQEIKDFNIQWFFILMAIGIPLVAIGFPLTILELSVASAIGSFWPSFLLCYGTKVSGNMVSFWLGRIFLSERLKILLCKNKFYKTLIFAVQKTPLKFAILFKFIPIPHIIKSYSLSITDIWWAYFLTATSIVSAIYAVVWVYLGTTLRNVYDELESGKMKTETRFLVARVVFIILSFSATFYLVYYAKSIFEEIEVQRKEEKKQRREQDADKDGYGTFE